MTVGEEAATAHAPAPRQWLGTLSVVFSALCFGMMGTAARLAYDGGSEPLTLAFLRIGALAVFAGFAIVLLRREWRLSAAAFRSTLWLGATTLATACGFLGAVAFIPVSLTALILYTYPLLVGVLASLTGREPMTAAKVALLLGAFVGLALALGPTFSDLDPRGLALAFLAALANSLTTVFGGPALRGRDLLVMNFYTNLWGALVLAAFLLLAGGFVLPKTDLGALGAAGAALLYIGAFLSWFAAMRLISPVRMAVLFNLDALVNILAGVFLLGESLSAVQVLGIIVVLGCVVVTGARRAG
jgi:drug/metabolite transporter (DMT)-like permease